MYGRIAVVFVALIPCVWQLGSKGELGALLCTGQVFGLIISFSKSHSHCQQVVIAGRLVVNGWLTTFLLIRLDILAGPSVSGAKGFLDNKKLAMVALSR